MLFIGLVIVALAALGGLVAVHLWFWRGYYRPDECGVDQIHFARTVDGWHLALHRYARHDTSSAPHAGQPVILCHGLGANRFTFDLDADVSLARWLRKRGWDVWCLELRGVGLSRHPADSVARQWTWGVEDYLRRDLPAAIEYVCKATGAPAVHWIGHSLGGTLGYAYLQGQGAERIRSATTIGSPAFLEPTYALQSIVRLERFFTWLPVLRISAVARFLAPFYIAARIKLVAINGAVIDGNVVRRAMSHLVTDMCGGVLRTLSHWVRTGTFSLGGVDFQAGLATIRTPLLVIAGDADPIAPPGECRRVVEAVASDERRFHVLGHRFGVAEDYGHGDLLFGRDVSVDVFPLIGEWLEARAADPLPPPLPDAVLEQPAEALAAPLRAEPGPGRTDEDDAPLDDEDTDDDDDDDEPAPPSATPPPHTASTLDGPYGLLARYSPARRRRWYGERRTFRARERAQRLTKTSRTSRDDRAAASDTPPPIEPVPVAPHDQRDETHAPDTAPQVAPATNAPQDAPTAPADAMANTTDAPNPAPTGSRDDSAPLAPGEP